MGKYYFITVMERVNAQIWTRPVFGNTRTWGFYTVFGEADRVLHNNITDLHEGCYDYAVVEEYEEGISGYTGKSWWYGYNEELDCYTRMDKPCGVDLIGSFAFG